MFIRVENGRVTEVSEKLTCEQHQDRSWKSSWDFKSFDEVQGYALYVTAITGESHVGADRGDHVSPQFDVIRIPHVGDKVSKGFNGDYYPEGEVVKITKNLTVITSTGARFRRYKNTSGWRKEGGTWWLINGHHDERNPHL